ncbi:hypothetical protein F511_22893 [Dorcoceras hygrometricum]|uniref:Uncharacterized protein n=1 Tax=Dorcoceras hygrometricum TaxID=472368 RepID=A0A2Z7BW37_9LAMI|nr:hypothetical protein F511_22893 [Dorcoceras hygrometricum]
MPKRRDRSLSFDRSRLSPYPYQSSSTSLIEENAENMKEWENTRCPVCMEHPHNAILLICSSHEKGCHPFMCDTSYRHSNCFDQFQKSFAETSDVSQTPDDVQNSESPLATAVSPLAVSDLESAHSQEDLLLVADVPVESPVKPKLVCPLCRGLITGWTVMESARRFMNSKSRSCACETCDFSGPYHDLRKHARLVHPLVRPTDTDPERQRNWRRLERQRDLGDLISTLQSSIGEDMADGRTLTIDDGGWLTVFFLVRFTRPPSTSTAPSQLAVRRRRPSRRLWGETIDGTLDSREVDVEPSHIERILPRRYVRRRFQNQENVAHDSRNNELESSRSGQRSPRFYVRRRLHNQETVAPDSRNEVEPPESGQSFPRLYVRRRRHNQESVRESGDESSDSG